MVNTRKRTQQDDKDRKCKIEKKKKKIRSGLDHISDLPDDCLLDIFTRIDHEDLDKICILSKRLAKVSSLARSRAVKVKANELEVVQWTEKSFRFTIEYNSPTKYFINISPGSNSNRFKEKKDNSGPTQRKNCSIPNDQETISNCIYSRASDLLERFAFERCVFDSVCIDSSILKLLELITNRSLITLTVKNCFFYDSPGVNVKDRFLAILLSSKASTLNLGFHGNIQVINQDFMREFSKTVPLPSLTVNGAYHNKWLLSPGKRFVEECLSNFGTLVMPRLYINSEFPADWLIPPLVARLRQHRKGHWHFHMKRYIQRAEIQTHLPPDMILSCLMMCGWDHTLYIWESDLETKVRISKYSQNRAFVGDDVWVFDVFFPAAVDS